MLGKYGPVAALLSLVVGCGPDFEGTFRGTLVATGSCTDGSSPNGSWQAAWTIAHDNSQVTVSFDGACSPITATAGGNRASIATKTCAPTGANGWVTTGTVREGVLTLVEDALTVSVAQTATGVHSAGATATCSVTVAGTITR